ncbi:MAG TPA: L-threonylcarbamoyladenylate synthase [Thermoanaerobaculia bacterium]|jgi:L-threonylcarbamoyladenylate synthase
MQHFTHDQLPALAHLLTAGGVVLMPTDTIYGLHAVATNARAVARIAQLKGRDDAKPFVVLGASVAQLQTLGISASDDVLRRLGELWPAPLTVILPLAAPLPASRGASTLAVRIPADEWLRELLLRTGPLVSTSANRSGEPPVEEPKNLARDLLNALDGLLDAGPRAGEASAIVDLTSDEPRFIRESHPSFTQKVWKTLRKTL